MITIAYLAAAHVSHATQGTGLLAGKKGQVMFLIALAALAAIGLQKLFGGHGSGNSN